MHIGTYVGAAAAGGIIGNRADAGIAGAVRRMLRSVRGRRPGRSGRAAPVTEEQAVELALAEVVRTGYAEQTISHLDVVREPGCWIVMVRAVHVTGGLDAMRVRVPFEAAAAPSVLVVSRGTS